MIHTKSSGVFVFLKFLVSGFNQYFFNFKFSIWENQTFTYLEDERS